MASVSPHLHIGFVEFLIFLMYFLIASFLVRMLEVWAGSNVFGQALSFIH